MTEIEKNLKKMADEIPVPEKLSQVVVSRHHIFLSR